MMQETRLAKLFYRSAQAYDVLNNLVHFPDVRKKRWGKISIFSGDGTVLEVGCGTGLSSKIFAGKNVRVFYLDINQAFVAYGKKKGRISDALVGTAYSLPFRDETFDTIVFPDAFHHVLEHDRLFSECSRTLRHGGKFIVFDIVHKTHAANKIINHFADGIIWDLNRDEFQKKMYRLAEQHGFAVEGFSVSREPTVMGLVLNGIDIEATLLKR